MHEMSLAQNLLSQLHELAEKHKLTKVCHLKVEVGRYSGIVVDSFEFGYSVLAAEYELTRKSVLEIIQPDTTFVCLDCGALHEDLPQKPEFCTVCQAETLSPRGGDDLILLQVEME